MIPLVGFAGADDPRFLSTLDRIEAELVTDSLVHRYHADGSDGFDEPEGTFNLCSFWYVEALTRAGRRRPGQAHLREDAHLRQPPRAVRGGDRRLGRGSGQLPAGVHAPRPDPRGRETGPGAGGVPSLTRRSVAAGRVTPRLAGEHVRVRRPGSRAPGRTGRGCRCTRGRASSTGAATPCSWCPCADAAARADPRGDRAVPPPRPDRHGPDLRAAGALDLRVSADMPGFALLARTGRPLGSSSTARWGSSSTDERPRGRTRGRRAVRRAGRRGRRVAEVTTRRAATRRRRHGGRGRRRRPSPRPGSRHGARRRGHPARRPGPAVRAVRRGCLAASVAAGHGRPRRCGPRCGSGPSCSGSAPSTRREDRPQRRAPPATAGRRRAARAHPAPGGRDRGRSWRACSAPPGTSRTRSGRRARRAGPRCRPTRTGSRAEAAAGHPRHRRRHDLHGDRATSSSAGRPSAARTCSRGRPGPCCCATPSAAPPGSTPACPSRGGRSCSATTRRPTAPS